MNATPLRVLIVDDHADNARMLQTLLKQEGYVTRIASDGPTALEAARFSPPDVALLDLGLPGMGGNELAAELRRFSQLRDCRIVAVTGYGKDALPSPSPFDRHFQTPRGDDLAPLAKKVDRFGSGPLKKGQPENAMLVTRLTDIQPGKPTDRPSEELFRDYAKLIKKKFVILKIEIISLESYQSKQRAAIESALLALEALLKRDEPYGALFEHEEIGGTCRAVIRCSGTAFKQLVESPEWQTRIAWFDGRPQFETFISTC
jgi:CheY-like chemotaxis protein